MLETIGVRAMNDLLVDIPQSLRLESLQLPDGLSEFETMAQLSTLAARNRVYPDRLTFRGGGVYRRFIPAAVAAVTSKPEFYTAYTPYQAEASQGTLQAIFEYQSLIAELTALDVSNASLYDGATAVAEAAMMAHVHNGRNEVLVSGYVHPEYVQVLRAFGEGRGIKVRKDGEPNKKTAAVIFQQPDFLGLLVDPRALTAAAHDAGALAIACVDPISLAILAPPGEYGADIAVGEGQQLGLAPSFGGPHVGFIACRKELVRKLPGLRAYEYGRALTNFDGSPPDAFWVVSLTFDDAEAMHASFASPEGLDTTADMPNFITGPSASGISFVSTVRLQTAFTRSRKPSFSAT